VILATGVAAGVASLEGSAPVPTFTNAIVTCRGPSAKGLAIHQVDNGDVLRLRPPSAPQCLSHGMPCDALPSVLGKAVAMRETAWC
jgi:hypothetical protein